MKLSLPRTFIGCVMIMGCRSDPGNDEVDSARRALRAALVDRDQAQVTQTARAAGVHEGKDPALDRLLGDALANVLMRPSQGLKMLEENPARGDEEWETAILSAAMRTGETAVFMTILEQTSATPFIPSPDLVAWTSAQALTDPKINVHTLRDRAADCTLFDAHPTRGRRTVDQPAPADLGEVLYQLGAERVVLGRAHTATDPKPSSGRGLQPCHTGRLFPGPALPKPLPRHLTVSMSVGEHRLHLSIRPEADAAWVFGSTQASMASQVVAESRRVSQGATAQADYLHSVLAGAPPAVQPPETE